MAFAAKISSWLFSHLNIVGCLLQKKKKKTGLDREVTGTPGFLCLKIFLQSDWLREMETVTNQAFQLSMNKETRR